MQPLVISVENVNVTWCWHEFTCMSMRTNLIRRDKKSIRSSPWSIPCQNPTCFMKQLLHCNCLRLIMYIIQPPSIQFSMKIKMLCSILLPIRGCVPLSPHTHEKTENNQNNKAHIICTHTQCEKHHTHTHTLSASLSVLVLPADLIQSDKQTNLNRKKDFF